MGVKKINVKFDDAIQYLENGDLALFSWSGFFGNLIKIQTVSNYNHVGVVVHTNGKYNPPIWEVAEYREFIGSRIVSLQNYVEQNPGKIDIYRHARYNYKYYFCPQQKRIVEVKVKFEGEKFTECMRKLTGLPYGWSRIFYIWATRIPILRWFCNYDEILSDLPDEKLISAVCSTSVAHCHSQIGWDSTRNKADKYIEPADFARSANLDYIFTLIP